MQHGANHFLFSFWFFFVSFIRTLLHCVLAICHFVFNIARYYDSRVAWVALWIHPLNCNHSTENVFLVQRLVHMSEMCLNNVLVLFLFVSVSNTFLLCSIDGKHASMYCVHFHILVMILWLSTVESIGAWGARSMDTVFGIPYLYIVIVLFGRDMVWEDYAVRFSRLSHGCFYKTPEASVVVYRSAGSSTKT